jgi:hypothetical protein
MKRRDGVSVRLMSRESRDVFLDIARDRRAETAA